MHSEIVEAGDDNAWKKTEVPAPRVDLEGEAQPPGAGEALPVHPRRREKELPPLREEGKQIRLLEVPLQSSSCV